MFSPLKHFVCFLFEGGHDFRIKSAPGRIWMRCENCGKKTPGWDTRKNQTESRTPGDNILIRARQLVHLSLVRIGFL